MHSDSVTERETRKRPFFLQSFTQSSLLCMNRKKNCSFSLHFITFSVKTSQIRVFFPSLPLGGGGVMFFACPCVGPRFSLLTRYLKKQHLTGCWIYTELSLGTKRTEQVIFSNELSQGCFPAKYKRIFII